MGGEVIGEMRKREEIEREKNRKKRTRVKIGMASGKGVGVGSERGRGDGKWAGWGRTGTCSRGRGFIISCVVAGDALFGQKAAHLVSVVLLADNHQSLR